MDIDQDVTVTTNPYKYNCKELERHFGLESYEYGARMMDPQLGMWHVVDPLADSFSWQSPYISMDDNPILKNDPNGKNAETSNEYSDNEIVTGATVGGAAGGIMAAGLAAGGTVALVGGGTVVGAPVGAVIGGGIIVGAAVGAGAVWLWGKLSDNTPTIKAPEPARIMKPQNLQIQKKEPSTEENSSYNSQGKNGQKINQKRAEVWKEREASLQKQLKSAKTKTEKNQFKNR